MENDATSASVWLAGLSRAPSHSTQRFQAYCQRILTILIECNTSSEEPSDQEIERFWLLWKTIKKLSMGHPPPASHNRKSGCDNYGRQYRVVARMNLQVGRFFERRYFLASRTVGYYYCHGRDQYFYYNPEDSFYGSYVVKEPGNGLAIVSRFRGVKMSHAGVQSYAYPPDTPARDKNLERIGYALSGLILWSMDYQGRE